MNKYNNTTIYKIVSKDINDKNIYIGMTTNFNKRKSDHKSNCNNVNDKHHNYRFVLEK